MLKTKKIILGVSGSIAAYKAAILTRLLVKAGAEVQVLMSPYATEFITPLTLATLSKKPVLVDFVKDKTGLWNNHVELGLWADAMLIAPASAHTLSKCAQGHCDNLLIATYLSARCPVFFAPAMDVDMYAHPSTQENLKKLQHYQNYIIPSETGELASGLEGQGRLAEPAHILEFLEDFWQSSQVLPLQNKKALVTAGPTQEAIDPVRYISNHSSGKMGYALAEALAEKGATVYLVSGPTQLVTHHPAIEKISVRSAQEMYQAAQRHFEEADIIVLAAAVADFSPVDVAKQKIKKQAGQEELTIQLRKTVDIAQTFGEQKQAHQLLVGFALETNDGVNNALGKLERKKLDMIVLNSLQEEGAGFGHDTNKITIISSETEQEEYSLKSKQAVAKDIVQKIITKLP